jgi:hypothetical protein
MAGAPETRYARDGSHELKGVPGTWNVLAVD